jgi:hypothetical protein
MDTGKPAKIKFGFPLRPLIKIFNCVKWDIHPMHLQSLND